MYEDLAWKNFLVTGNIESFLEYKRIKELKENISIRDDIKESCE